MLIIEVCLPPGVFINLLPTWSKNIASAFG